MPAPPAETLSPFDGWAHDPTPTCGYKDYVFPNNKAQPLWYHDHTDMYTSATCMSGLAAPYYIKVGTRCE